MNSRALETVCRVVLVLMGVITAGPALALFSSRRLSGYGLDVAALDPMVLALLQHRGMLQAALGASLVWAAFQPGVRIPAALTAIATKSTFLVLTLPLEILPGAVFDMVAITILAAIAFRQAWLIRSAGPAPKANRAA